ncbi:MAG: type II CAAX endopeptidase family protein [Candidatus Babeliales bacterium]
MTTSILCAKRPLCWIVLTSICISGLLFTYHYFGKAFPIIDLDLSLDRARAMEQARSIAHRASWGPDEYQQAVNFESDDATKNFIELEGGGRDALRTIIKENIYCPYFWHVRHFKEKEIQETHIYFKPDGQLYGFKHSIADEQPGAALSSEQARTIAQKQAHDMWHIPLDAYTLIETSQEKKASKRIDHSFTYERTNKKIGEGTYRMHLVVSGDALTEYTTYIHVPEAFERRYEHMRSLNDLIGSLASVLYALCYFFIGTLLVLFFSARYTVIPWRSAFLASCALGILVVLSELNSFPLSWINYDTAIAKNNIYSKFALSLISSFSYIALIYGLIFASAELLTRHAFGHHLQLWKLWRRENAASFAVLGRTVGGYLLLGYDLAFAVAVYIVGAYYFGWWTPSSTLINPNILGTPFPWLDAISSSLVAGFFEECAFRAIPLSLAALAGKRWGKPRLCLIVGFIIQALIFGAAHATYPSQPAYARIIELFIPSCIFGILYLVYGLLPAIISHFIYDVFWFALPIFISTAPGIWRNQLLVIIAAAVPLLIVLVARYRVGRWLVPAPEAYNSAWRPQKNLPAAQHPVREYSIAKQYALQPIIMYACAGVALIALFFNTQRTPDFIGSTVDRATAITISRAYAAQQQLTFNTPWRTLPWYESSLTTQMLFAWQEDKAWYKQLLGTYIPGGQWRVRYARFEGDLVDTAQEYQLFINHTHAVNRVNHIFAESAPDNSLQETHARELAFKTMADQFQLQMQDIEEISAISRKQPNRTDWEFVFKDIKASNYTARTSNGIGGQARIDVHIAGTKISDYYRYLFIPQEWERVYKELKTQYGLISTLCSFALIALLISYALRALWHALNQMYAIRAALVLFGALLIKSYIQVGNFFFLLTANFDTDRPFWSQYISAIGPMNLDIIMRALFWALLLGLMLRIRFHRMIQQSRMQRASVACAIGIIAHEILALTDTVVTTTYKPVIPDYLHASMYIPALSVLLVLATQYISSTLTLWCVYATVDSISYGWQRRKHLALLFCIIAGALLQGYSGIDSIHKWIIMSSVSAALIAVSYVVCIRFDRALIPVANAARMIGVCIAPLMWQAYPGALFGHALFCLLLIPGSIYWMQLIDEHEQSAH